MALVALLGVGLVALGTLLWVPWDIAVGGIAAMVLGIVILGLAVRGWTINRGFRRDGAHVATALLDAADRAERKALAEAATGDREAARSALELAADRLRALAPGSGRPGEVLERALRLRDAAASIRG